MQNQIIKSAKHLYKDYYLFGGTLVKIDIDDSKHLLWSKGGVPCIDAGLWNENKDKITQIYFRTRKNRTFKIKKDVFDVNKKELDFGFGRQYWIEKELWIIN